MNNRYKIILSNNQIYKEIELDPEQSEITVGTAVECTFRLHRRMFFESIGLTLTRQGDSWNLSCSDNLYLSVGDIRKLLTLNLTHGDSIEVKYQKFDSCAIRIDFLVDFNDGKRKYERAINIMHRSSISIGSARSNDIIISGPYIYNDNIELYKRGSGLLLSINCTTYGIFHNGRKASDQTMIANGDFFSVSDFFFYYKDDTLWTEIRNDIQLTGLTYTDHAISNAYPKFSRSTRVKTVVNDNDIEVLDPPAKPQKPKNNWLLKLLPSMGMLVAGGMMAFMGGTMVLFSIVSCAMAVITTVVNIRQGNKDYDQSIADRYRKYTDYIARKRAEIEQARANERRALEEIYIPQQLELDLLHSFSPNLFDRTPSDEDYLCVRLGSGAVKSRQKINYKQQEKLEIEDDLQLIPAQLESAYTYIDQAPIVCNLKENSAIGVVGPEEYRFSFLKNMVVDLAARQYFTDLKMVFVAESSHKDQIRWLRMLPHVVNEQTGIRNIVCDDESKNLIFEYLYKELCWRKQNKHYGYNIVVFFYDDYGFMSHPISRFMDGAKDLGVTFIFFGNTRADIPMGCGYLVDIRNHQIADLVNTQDKADSTAFVFPYISDQQARETVMLLAPVYTEEISLESTLTRNISLFDLLNIIVVDDLDLDSRWKKSEVHRSLSAPLGVSKTGIVSLDLHDKAHGPHGLVAGTTGSGKSEILQTYILSMATLFHPYEVAFVIIDFKGGGMVNQFRDLPHLLGAITNIDGKEISRSLKSIKAELKKRQRLFAEADVNHIDKYIKKYKAHEVSRPLPHLIIIVDEFAELKADQPEFMKELISAARIGRSLGVHLILATQKPSGQVNEQIWSNSRFKLCLKVQTQEDSNEVLKSPLAAEIKEPGRAYLQVGNNEIFELFQSAYSGVSEKAVDSNEKEFSIYSLSDSGKRTPVFIKKKKAVDEGGVTQLDAIVQYVSEHCEAVGLKKLPDICLPSLRPVIHFPDPDKLSGSTGQIRAAIGVFDDPDNQYQGQYHVDLSSSNLMLIGSSQSGKTNILQSIIRSLSTNYTPNEVNIYIIDFASMVLKNYEQLNHVGGVVTASEDEKLKNLMKLLKTQIEFRKEKLLSVGVSSFAAYKEAGMTDLPLIVLMIDNLTALKELYFQDDEELLSLCRESLAVGISIVIANSHTTGIGYKYLANFSSRIALFCNDSSEYSSLFEHCSERIGNIPGRCIVDVDKRHLECQAFLAFDGEKEFDRALQIRSYIAETNKRNNRMMANIIPVIPEILSSQYVASTFGGYMSDPGLVAVGLDYNTVSPMVLDFTSLGVLAVSGRENSGKHNFLRLCIRMLEKTHPGTSEVYIVDGIRRKLSDIREEPNVVSYDFLASAAAALVKDVEQKLKQRYDALAAGNDTALEEEKLIVLILNSTEAMELISVDPGAVAAYRNITGKYKNMKVCVLLGQYENTTIPYSAPEVIKKAKEAKHFVFFDDLVNMKILDLPMATLRNFKKPIELGDAYYIRETKCVKLKTAIDRV